MVPVRAGVVSEALRTSICATFTFSPNCVWRWVKSVPHTTSASCSLTPSGGGRRRRRANPRIRARNAVRRTQVAALVLRGVQAAQEKGPQARRHQALHVLPQP